MRVPSGSPVIGQPVSHIKLPQGTLLTAVIHKNGELKPVVTDPELAADDAIVAITPPEKEDELWHALTGEARR